MAWVRSVVASEDMNVWNATAVVRMMGDLIMTKPTGFYRGWVLAGQRILHVELILDGL